MIIKFGLEEVIDQLVLALLGCSVNDRYIIGYSYDILNKLADYSSSSHEFMLAIKLKTTATKTIKCFYNHKKKALF